MVSFERNKMPEFLDILFVLLTTINVFRKSLPPFVNQKNKKEVLLTTLKVMGEM